MTAKSIFLTAAAAAGMVAVADVWDIKFTLKTVQNDKKVSVTLKGAWDDAVDGQYSFWDNKTKVALKDVAFSRPVRRPTATAATRARTPSWCGADLRIPRACSWRAASARSRARAARWSARSAALPLPVRGA